MHISHCFLHETLGLIHEYGQRMSVLYINRSINTISLGSRFDILTVECVVVIIIKISGLWVTMTTLKSVSLCQFIVK